MAREILFKAKRIDNGEWIEGYYFKSYGCRNGKRYDVHIIHNYDTDENYLIDIETLCQYTGLTDKNGNKIWENDVINVHVFYEIAEGHGNHERVQGVICYDSMGMLSVRTDMHENIPCYSDILLHANIVGEEVDFEVIGNIFDNPELLGGGE